MKLLKRGQHLKPAQPEYSPITSDAYSKVRLVLLV